MKIPVTIEYASPGLQPPVYLCTDLTDPAWELVEMDHATTEHGENHFAKTFNVDEGEYQYKIRLGSGDWWVTDDSKPTVDDGGGNKNNLLVVKPVSQPNAGTSTPGNSVRSATPVSSDSAPALIAALKAAAPPSPAQITPVMARKVEFQSADFDHSHDAAGAPKDVTPTSASNVKFEDKPEVTPLFRHETLSPITYTHETNPTLLFRHETMGAPSSSPNLLPQHARTDSGHDLYREKPRQSSIPAEADPNDPSLIPFPTDVQGIREHLASAHRRMSEDVCGGPGRDENDFGAAASGSDHQLEDLAEEDEEDDEEGDYDEDEDDDEVEPEVVVVYKKLVVHPAGTLTLTPPLTPQGDKHEDEEDEGQLTEPNSHNESGAEGTSLRNEGKPSQPKSLLAKNSREKPGVSAL